MSALRTLLSVPISLKRNKLCIQYNKQRSSEGLPGRGGRRGRIGRAQLGLLYRALQRVDRVALIIGHHVGLVNALQNVSAAFLQPLRVDSRLLRQLPHHAAHVPLVDGLAVGLEGVQKFHLVVVLVKPIEERGDLWLVGVDAALDEFFLLQSLEAGERDLVEEAAPFLLAFPRLHLSHQLVAVQAGQLFLFGVAQLHHPPHQLLLLDLQVAVQPQQGVVSCPYELLQRDTRLARVDRAFKQEQDYQLRLNVKSELLDLGVVDLVKPQQAVVVVDGVEGVHELVDVSVAEVELEGGEHVEV